MADAFGLIDVDPQETLLADLPLDVHDFEAEGARHALSHLADFFELHRYSAGRAAATRLFIPNKKVGSRPLGFSTGFNDTRSIASGRGKCKLNQRRGRGGMQAQRNTSR